MVPPNVASPVRVAKLGVKVEPAGTLAQTRSFTTGGVTDSGALVCLELLQEHGRSMVLQERQLVRES
jgi:hypothetical protein